MIPIKSTTAVVGALLAPDNVPKRAAIDYEMGGVALQDPSQGLRVQQWRAWFDPMAAAPGVFIESATQPQLQIFEQNDIAWLSFCFDQNMRWSAVYTLNDDSSYLRWYNSLIGDYEILALDKGVISPFLTMDDKRATQMDKNDMILAYIQKQTVFVRVQRERFLIPHVWAEKIPKDCIIRNFGMSNKLRLQMEIR